MGNMQLKLSWKNSEDSKNVSYTESSRPTCIGDTIGIFLEFTVSRLTDEITAFILKSIELC